MIFNMSAHKNLRFWEKYVHLTFWSNIAAPRLFQGALAEKIIRGFTMKRLPALLLSLAVLLSCALSAQASGTESHNKIRVGYFTFPGFQEVGDDGRYHGYGYDYLQEIAKYTGWDYEFVDATWEECQDLLARGEIDLLGSAQKTEARLELYDYPELSSGISYAVLCARTEDTTLAYEDFAAFDGMTVGILAGNSRNNQLNAYCEANGFSVRTVLFEDQGQLADALHAGQVDVLLTSNLRREIGERIVARFAPSPFYFVTTKGNQAVLDGLDYAQNQIKLANPFFDVQLNEKYYGVTEEELPVFTQDEHAYLETHPTLRVACNPDWGPLSLRDGTGAFTGVAPDVFERIRISTGISFTFVPVATLEEAERLLANGEADLIAAVDREYSPVVTELTLTTSYISIPNVIVNDPRHDLPVSQTVAVTPDFFRTNDSDRLSELANTISTYPTSRDCFEALYAGEVSASFVNAHVADALRADHRYRRFQISALPDIEDELCVAMSRSGDVRLLSILNKCIQYLSNEEMQNIIIENTVFNSSMDLADYFYENPVQAVLIIAGILLLIILLLVSILLMRSRAAKRVAQLMYRDALTGIWNFNYFLPALGKLLASGKGGQYAVVYTDIRRFKDLNSSYGYEQGSQVLRHVGEVLRAQAAPDELCARISADNFITLLHYGDDLALIARLKEVDKQINTITLPGLESLRLHLSSGVYLIRPEDRDAATVVDRASDARKSIKEFHKSWYAFYDTAIETQINVRREIESCMESSLAENRFIPYFQAKFDLKTGEIVGAEALVRWLHPDRGLVQPYTFIPIFERNGFIIQVDFCVFESVCRTIRQELDDGIVPVPISSNFSRVHFSRPGFVQQFTQIAERYAIPPNLLEIEVTESILEETPEHLIPTLQTLREAGYRISMDDFGSGYSSLNLLRDLPVDILKLDKDFLQKGIVGGRDLIILDGFVEMAHKLEIVVICEGVETREQEAFLRALGCDLAQGFLYARPVPLGDFEQRLLKSRGL